VAVAVAEVVAAVALALAVAVAVAAVVVVEAALTSRHFLRGRHSHCCRCTDFPSRRDRPAWSTAARLPAEALHLAADRRWEMRGWSR
jgi:hypothetical protein